MIQSEQPKMTSEECFPNHNAFKWPCRVAYATHPGKRSRQEDALLVNGLCILPSGQSPVCSSPTLLSSELKCNIPCIFAIADGMGGHNAGDLASAICVSRISSQWEKIKHNIVLSDAIQIVQSLVQSISSELHDMAQNNVKLRNMGTTLVVLLVCRDGCAVLNIGDSRAYSYKDGALHPLTKDDTEGQRLLDFQLATAEEIKDIDGADRLLRYVGKYQPGLIVRASEITIEYDRQVILLCSDGVSKMLYESDIQSILQNEDGMLQQVEMMVHSSTSRSDSDNTSAMLIQIG